MKPTDFYHDHVRPRLTAQAVYSGVNFRQRRGRYWRGPCPLHDGDRPDSFSVDTETLGWRCFSTCGTGDALSFLAGGATPTGERFRETVRDPSGRPKALRRALSGSMRASQTSGRSASERGGR